MPPRVPVYRRQVGVYQGSSYRVPSTAAQTGRAVQALGRGVQQLAGGAAQAVQGEMDRRRDAVIQNARAKAAELRIQFEKDLDERHGTNLLERASVSPKELAKKLDEVVGKDFDADDVEWQRIRDREVLGHKSTTNKRVVREADKMEEESYKANLENDSEKMKYASDDEVKSIVDSTRNMAKKRAADLGMTEDVAAEFVENAMTDMHVIRGNVLLQRGQWQAAQEYLNNNRSEMNSKEAGTLQDDIDAMRIDEVAEVESSKLLAAGTYESALQKIDKMDRSVDEKKAIRAATTQRNQMRRAAKKQADAPLVGQLSENIWMRGKNPYSNEMRPLMNKLASEQREIVAKEWYSYKGSRRSARSEERAAHNLIVRNKMAQYAAELLDPNIKVRNPLEPDLWFADLPPWVRSRMRSMQLKAGRFTSDTKNYLLSSVNDYFARRKMDPESDEAKKIKADIMAAVTKHATETSDLKISDLEKIVEPIILREARKSITVFPWESEFEETRKVADPLLESFRLEKDRNDAARIQSVPADLELKIRHRILVENPDKFDSIVDVPDAMVVRLHDQMKRQKAEKNK